MTGDAVEEPKRDWPAIASLLTAGPPSSSRSRPLGDHEGGRRTMGGFKLRPREDGDWLAAMVRQWKLDGAAPRWHRR